MIIYTVGNNKQFKSIQAAINSLTALFSSSPSSFSETVMIEVYEGEYGGFIIPANSIPATQSKRFIIKAKPNNKVRLSGLVSSPALGHGSPLVGIGIANANKFITIDGLIIENFHKGIVLSAGCHNARVQSTFIQRCANAAVWVYRADRFSLVNSVLLDFDHGLVLSDVNDVFICGNDIINMTDIRGTADVSDQFNLYLTTRRPNDRTINGTFVVYNNNITANGGTLIGYGPNVIAKLRSDYNNLYNPGGVYAKELSEIKSSYDATNISMWQTISSNDFNSISVNSPYYLSRQTSTTQYTDIALGNYILFDGLGKGMPNLANASVAGTTGAYVSMGTIPAYVDASELGETVQSNYVSSNGSTSISRPNPPAIGAYDSSYDVGGFATTLVAPVGYGSSGIDSPACIGISLSGNLAVEEKFSQSVDCVHPAIVPGFFNIHDAQYYLYANKASYYLEDCTTSEFIVGAELHDIESDGTSGIQAYLNGDPISKDNFSVVSNVFRLRHKGLNISDPDSIITLVGTVYKFHDTSFTRQTFRQSFILSKGIKRYHLPVERQQGAPIVITDDMVYYSDNVSMLGREFTLVWDDIEKKTEIKFSNNTNLLRNPQFDYVYSGMPQYWELYKTGQSLIHSVYTTTVDTLSTIVSSGNLGTGQTADGTASAYSTYTGLYYTNTGAYNLHPVLGRNYLLLSGSSYSENQGLRQRITIDSNAAYWASIYAAVPRHANDGYHVTGMVSFRWKWYDINNKVLSLDTGDTSGGVTQISINSDYSYMTGLWSRVAVPFARVKDTTLNKPSPTGVLSNFTMTGNPIPIPYEARYMDLIIAGHTGVFVDCAALTKGYDLQDYSRPLLGNEITIEYETGLSNLYRVSDLTLTAIRNRNNAGFVYIAPIPAAQFDPNAPSDTNTLTDWGWATGRLSYLPWAKVSGKNKIRHRSNFSLVKQLSQEDTFINSYISYPSDIETLPRIPVANLEDGIGPTEQIALTGVNKGPGVKGTDFLIRVTDNNGNPYAFENVTIELVSDIFDIPNPSYIGLLAKRELGYYTEYNTKLSLKTDSAGSVPVRWIPPASDNTQVEINNSIDSIGYDSQLGYRYIDKLPYKVNPGNMGNVFMSTPSNPYGYNMTGASYTTAQVAATSYDRNLSLRVYNLPSVPHRHTMDVWINATGTYPPNTGLSYAYQMSDTYDLLLTQSDNPEMSEGQYYVDEHRKLLYVKYTRGSNDRFKGIYTRYKNRSAFLLSDAYGVIDNKKLYLSDDFYMTLLRDVSPSNPLSINYDIVVDTIITAHSPTGVTPELRTVIDTVQSTGTAILNIREKVYNGSLIGKCIPKRVGF